MDVVDNQNYKLKKKEIFNQKSEEKRVIYGKKYV